MPADTPPSPQSSIILYQAEDGRTRIQCRFENETIWLTQALIAELFQKDVRTINAHLVRGGGRHPQATRRRGKKDSETKEAEEGRGRMNEAEIRNSRSTPR